MAPLTGREDQLHRLREAALSARSGVPRTVVVEGEAGIGKTRLVAELALEEAARGAVVLWGNCSAVAGRDVPLGPFVDALGDLRRALGDDALARAAGPRLPVLAGLVPGAFDGNVSGPAPTLGQVFGVVTDVLRAASASRPVLLLLEDVHWSDGPTLDLVDYLARSMRSEQLLVVVTARTDDEAYERVRGPLAEVGRAPGSSRIGVPRLTAAQVADQARALDGAGEPQDMDRIVHLSGGVPFLVEQVVDAGVEQSGVLASRLLGHRIVGLGPEAREVVDAAAVALSSPGAGDLGTVTELGATDVERGLLDAVRTGVLVVRGESIDFRARPSPGGGARGAAATARPGAAPALGRGPRRRIRRVGARRSSWRTTASSPARPGRHSMRAWRPLSTWVGCRRTSSVIGCWGARSTCGPRSRMPRSARGPTCPDCSPMQARRHCWPSDLTMRRPSSPGRATCSRPPRQRTEGPGSTCSTTGARTTSTTPRRRRTYGRLLPRSTACRPPGSRRWPTWSPGAPSPITATPRARSTSPPAPSPLPGAWATGWWRRAR